MNIFKIKKKSLIFIVALDCTSLPTFVNGNSSGKGCSGAVWKDGRPSKQYCVNDDKFPWWKKCCRWHEGKCIAKRDPVSSNAISPNAISLESGIPILCLVTRHQVIISYCLIIVIVFYLRIIFFRL